MNNLQNINRKNAINIETTKIKKKSTEYDKGETYYNFSSLKTIKKNITVSKSLINTIKGIIYFILGFSVPILFYVKPEPDEILKILFEILKNIAADLYVLTPYSLGDFDGKFIYSLNVGTIFSILSILLIYLLLLKVQYFRWKWLLKIVSIVIFGMLWYINFVLSYLIIKITFLYKVTSVLSLFIINVIMDFIILLFIDWVCEE